MRMTASWFRSLDLPDTRLWRDLNRARRRAPPLIVITDRTKHLNLLTNKAPNKGRGADSEEKHEPASDVDTAAVDSLKALAPDWPIREADIGPYLTSHFRSAGSTRYDASPSLGKANATARVHHASRQRGDDAAHRACAAIEAGVGFVHSSSPGYFAQMAPAFREGLKEAGYIEGQNLVIEYRWAEGQYDRLPALWPIYSIARSM